MSSDTERFRRWRAEQLAKAQADTRQARQGLQRCQQGPQCCAGWQQRVAQAQRRAAALQDPAMSQDLYSMDSSGIGERKTIGQGGMYGMEHGGEEDERVARQVVGVQPRAGKVAARTAMERGWGGGDDDERVIFDAPPSVYRPKG